jgi:pimeloyl-ACP methyl ester carboxylesterase
MKNHRLWGSPPYKVVTVHGGPGAPGSIAPVARELSAAMGVLEPLQTASSVEGQLEELMVVLKEYGDTPITLIGWSWGAILSYLTAARYPALVKKLILISTPPLEMKRAPNLTHIWLSRLSEAERVEFLSLENTVYDGREGSKGEIMGRLFRLIAKADSYSPVACDDDVIEYQLDINISVGLELRKLLASGKLLDLGENIKCPVAAIHGDYDPRPAAAVKSPLSRAVKNLTFITLEKCGHYPWMEKHAREQFFKVLREEIG